MNHKAYEKALRIIIKTMGVGHMKWWLCFGNLLHLIRDKNVKHDHDIDVGVYEEDVSESIITNIFLQWQYTLKKRIIDNTNKKILYLSYKNRNLPPIDVFVWKKWKEYRFHTYDVLHEDQKVPSRYIFKGVKEKWLPRLGVIDMKDDRLKKSHFGEHAKPLFFEAVNIPLQYGTLFDYWYPDWMTPRQGESTSPWKVEMKSCSKWSDTVYIKSQLEKSEAEFEGLKVSLCRGA